jgi:hypothetical protein
MPNIKIDGLQPGQTYQMQFYTIKTLPDGTTSHSANSQAFTFKTPSTAASGSNFSNPNSNSDTQLTGGSIFAGSFPSNIGNIDIVNDEVDGTGVILNQYGIAGFAGGTKEFWIDAATGKAYFAGNVTAGTVKIGPGVNPINSPTVGTAAGTKDGIYINDTNYWYSDGTWQARFSDIAGALTNKKIDGTLILPDAPAWNNTDTKWVGSSLQLAWTFNASGTNNNFAKNFIIEYTAGAFTGKTIVPVGTNLYTLTITQNKSLFGIAITEFTNIKIYTEDTFGNQSATKSSLSPIPTYSSSLSAPTISTVSPINNGYTVAYFTSTDASFYAISIEESETSSTANDFKVVYSGPGIKIPNTLNSNITILAENLNQRWIRARFYDEAGGHGPYSTVYAVTPSSPITINTNAPSDVTIVSSAFQTINSVANAGEDIEINVTLPSTNYGETFIVKLVPDSRPAASGYFYFTRNPDTLLNQKFIITKQNIYSQLGGYYSSFTGNVTSVSLNGIKSNNPPSITINSRINSLSAVNPTSTSKVVAIADGYSATFDFSNTTATSAEIYQKYTSWSGITTPADNFTGTFSSGGSSGGNTLVISGVIDEDLNTVASLPTGYPIFGKGIPSYTYVSAVSGTGPFTLTLSKNLTEQASGTYKMDALSYSGGSPAVIYSTNYVPIYIIIRYYDDFGNASLPSTETQVTPVNPGDVTSFQSAVNVSGTNGSIYVGTSPTSTGSRVILSGNGNSNNPTGFSGLFAYDNANNITTRILANTTNGAYTFATTSAHIADWNITSSKIENTITTPSSGTYTGLSGSGTYAFWAGSSASGGNSTANFSVTPAGAVVARKISIVGDGTTSDLINAADLFKVTNAGALTATSATISGAITATSGTFSGNVIIGATGSIYSKNVVPATSNGQGFILNQNGLRFNSSSVNGITTIDGSTGLLTTKAANIGGWLIDTSAYPDSIYTSVNNNTILLDAANSRISASTTNGGGYYVGMATPTGTSSNVVMWAGSSGVASTNNKFYVTADGTLNAKNATLTGTFTLDSSSTIDGTSTTDVKKGATAIQPGNGVGLDNSKQITTINTAGIRIGTAPTATGNTARVEINSGGFFAYDGSTQTVAINSNGSASFSGELKSAYGTFTGSVIVKSGTKTTTIGSDATISMVDTSTGFASGALTITSSNWTSNLYATGLQLGNAVIFTNGGLGGYGTNDLIITPQNNSNLYLGGTGQTGWVYSNYGINAPANSISAGSNSGTATLSVDNAMINNNGYVLGRRYNAPSGYFGRYGTSGTVEIVRFNYSSSFANMADAGGINISTGTPAFRAPSDYRLKDQIIDYTDSLAKINLARVRSFIMKSDPDHTSHIGFIAHEFAEAFPDFVQGEKDAIDKDGNPEYQSIMTTNLIPYLVGAIQELNLKIEALKK